MKQLLILALFLTSLSLYQPHAQAFSFSSLEERITETYSDFDWRIRAGALLLFGSYGYYNLLKAHKSITRAEELDTHPHEFSSNEVTKIRKAFRKAPSYLSNGLWYGIFPLTVMLFFECLSGDACVISSILTHRRGLFNKIANWNRKMNRQRQ